MWNLVNTRVTYVGFMLLFATSISLWTASDISPGSEFASSLTVLIIAFIKINFVGMYFMELRHAPFIMKAIFNGWCCIACATIVTLTCLV